MPHPTDIPISPDFLTMAVNLHDNAIANIIEPEDESALNKIGWKWKENRGRLAIELLVLNMDLVEEVHQELAKLH